ncbi:pilus assembly protein [Paenibacillus pinistramenti]|uniref:pilus assembly protein n=1 Tax=Paenibacillus pinistramenti TaxID=1768003 RepID=UPI001EEFB7AC|nr:pilus assembly protein [Paenibacillus pinistramenti]
MRLNMRRIPIEKAETGQEQEQEQEQDQEQDQELTYVSEYGREQHRQKKGFKQSGEGGMVLEASLVLPLFIIFIFFFSYMVQMTLTSTRMQAAVENAVKQVTANIYPVYLAVQSTQKESGNAGEAVNSNDADSSGGRESLLSIKDFADSFSTKLPSPLSDWLVSAAEQGKVPIEQLQTEAAEAVLDPLIKPILEPFLKESGLNPERAHVSKVVVPDLKTGKTPYFGIEISYELPIHVPFTQEKLFLQSKAYERLWIGDTNELKEGMGSDGESTAAQPLVLEKPNPAFAGRRASIQAKISPGGTANLTIYYKSGKSTAKYLGTAAADENGVVEWTWLVGGNTTPGTWTFVIETPEGGRTEAVFAVESPNKSNK